MTEDHNDQSTEQPAGGPGQETPASPMAETADEAIALPAATPPPPAEPLTLPVQPQTPTHGVPQGVPLGMAHTMDHQPDPDTAPQGVPDEAPATTGSTPAAGTYAMGALAGNPALEERVSDPLTTGGAGGFGGFGGPPTDPNAPIWSAPHGAGSSTGAGGKHSDHTFRNGLLAGAAAVALLGAGIGIGAAAWSSNNPSNLSAQNASGGVRVPSGSGNGFNGSRFGNGSPAGGGNFGGGGSGNSSNSGNSGNSGGSGSTSSGAGGPSDVSAIASKVDPGLVDVNTTLGYQQEEAAGTGIVLTSNGIVLTNNHVIDGATSISVTDVGSHKTYTASVVGYDRTKDIAVLQLNNASGLQTATIGNSSNASVGEQVVGIGNAGGTGGTPSAAGGTVTALNQSITASDEGDGTSEQLSGLIQTNADIQPGDSGGALVNTSGQVLGVDTAASDGYSFQYNGQSSGNQGFAIPINTALSIAHSIENGNASTTVHIGETAFLGVEISPNGSSSGSSGGSPFGGFGGGGFGGNSGGTGNTGNTGGTGNTGSSGAGSSSGASVAGVVTNGPAQEAGIAEGDVITSIGGKTISSANDLTNDMGIYHPGDKVQIGWTDGSGQSHTATVQLSSGPPQ
jgi:S1-C subfamily serine protease